jgi:iron(III) transport system substrate-binding protein
MKPKVFLALAGVAIATLVAAAALWPKQEGVTIYCAVDDVHAIPILDAFEQETGIHVHRNFDTEANKTVGLVQKLREERGNPRADVFWNNEIMHTIRLGRESVLAAYDSPAAKDIPAEFRDTERLWTGFGARARILIVNSELVTDNARPTSMSDLLDAQWRGRSAFVRPLTGTTLTHAAVLYTVLGDEAARTWFRGMHDNECLFPSGNGSLARSVAGGQAAFGFTDTDDYEKVLRDGRPVTRVYPDQQEGGIGTLLIPNTVALIKGGPRPDLGKQLIDFLLSERVEEMLAHGDSAQIPVRASVKRPPSVIGPPEFRAMQVDWDDVVDHFDERLKELEALWR